MSNSQNKGYSLQDTGSNIGTWGAELNNNALNYIDQNMGGYYPVTLSASDVSINPPNNRNAIFRFTGTLLANVIVTISNVTNSSPLQYGGGFFFVENLTSGNFTVSVRNTNVATAAIVPQGMRTTLISDSTNGVRIASSDAFPSGTAMLFMQASAPSGWTKSTTHDNKALRIVNSSGGGSGGSLAFTSVLAARTIITSNLPDHNITITDPGHFHTVNAGRALDPSAGLVLGGGTYAGQPYVAQNRADTQYNTTGISAAFGTSARGGAQTNMDFAVQYVDAIICTKN